MTIITLSFVKLMTADQRQATYSDLSQSAYDSAQAGVEDAKRLLLLNKACQDGTADSVDECAAAAAALTPGEGDSQTGCDALSKAGIVTADNGETMLRQQSGDSKLDQAYTCVKIKLDTPDLLGSVQSGASPVLIPLRGTKNVSKVVVSWGINKSGGVIDLLPLTDSKKLPPITGWPETRPALLRAQIIDGKSTFRLSDFDGRRFSDTLFLAPSSEGSELVSFGLDSRRTTPVGNAPQPVKCSRGAGSGAYICRVTLDLPDAISAKSRTAFLSLSALYNATDFKIELQEGVGGTIVPFDGVQPEVDSTGRANDLFRRVRSRVELNGTFNYPQAEIETSGSLCKNFSVTTDPNDYDTSTCEP